jgi:hypothetical protein
VARSKQVKRFNQKFESGFLIDAQAVGDKMAEFEIRCVVRGRNGIITHIGTGNELFSVEEVVMWIRQKIHSFHTFQDGYMARVYPRNNYWGTWYLSTSPDGILEDNLGYLPECQM